MTTRRFFRRLASLTRSYMHVRGGQEMTAEITFAVNCALALKQVTTWTAERVLDCKRSRDGEHAMIER